MTNRSIFVGLSSWIIQDGNYDDFRVGMDVAFALEFHAAAGLHRVEGLSEYQLIRVSDSTYKASGQVIHLASDWWVVDFGIPVFDEAKPPVDLSVGDFVRGEINIGVDPFFYVSYLGDRLGAPALIGKRCGDDRWFSLTG